MKYLNYLSALLFCFLIFGSHAKTVNTDNTMNAMKILHLDSNNFIGKVLFVYRSQVDKRPEFALNNLDYKIIQVTQTEIIFYSTPNQYEAIAESSLNLSDYLVTIKLSNIDLACNDYLYLCKLREFKKAYQTKMPDVDFNTNPNVILKMGKQTDKNCLILTMGAFQSIQDLPYLCFENMEHLVYLQNLLTDRILKLNSESYSGAVEMLNHSHNGFLDGILEMRDQFMIYYFRTQTITFNYDQVDSYALTVFKKETIPWMGSSYQNPDPAKCFRIILKTKEILYFCNYFSRKDVLMRHMLTTSNSVYEGNILVARLNMKLHNFNLKKAQEAILKAGKLDCQSEEMESIKYEIRTKYLITRHKLGQLISLNKIPMKKGLKMIDDSKNKIVETSCFFYGMCIKAAESCIRSGLLPLKIKGYELATTLQNPYISLIPKTSLKSKEAQRLISKELYAEARQLITNRKSLLNSSNIRDGYLPEVPSAEDIKKAFNTFASLFEIRKEPIVELEEAGRYCRWMTRGSIHNLKKKVYYLSNASINDPFFEYLGSIKNKII